ncbi:OPT superfamily oligopeptide transporter [Trichodelitschia bisporula]|uniref:OPT superfamily oligopeptide transporter n=1 Tax=Trichodelitschia bisporula TaxID=703511 RepID=A0A6G1HYB3_9PEZI|nr:OPT superfamily oligopeptide transporter [Trichodelitschia bisporula]
MADIKGPTYRAKPISDDGSTEQIEFLDEKKAQVHVIDRTDSSDDEIVYTRPPKDTHDLVTEVILAEDDPTLNPWTFRTWFLGLSIACFAAATTAINTFKPQPVHIHLVFIAVLSYVLGEVMAKVLPSRGRIGRIINPHPFNKKEHAAICIMAVSGGSTPEAMMILAVQKLWYGIRPHPFYAICLIFSAQMLGYGVAGLLRKTLVYPTKMFYPANLPTASLLESLHKDKVTTKRKMKVFYIGLAVLFCWQAFPQYIMPVLGGVSIFCLTHRNSLFVTNLFGGSMANEGLGVLALSFDWQLIAGAKNPMWLPLQTQVNELIGYVISIGMYMGIFYSNTWHARSLPFLSPLLFHNSSTAHKYVTYDVKKILNKKWEVDEGLLANYGLPSFSASYATSLTTINIAIAATITHMLLWHYHDIKSAWAFMSGSNMIHFVQPWKWHWKFWENRGVKITKEEAEAIDPHYALMTEYEEVPGWWFGSIWIAAVVVGMTMCYLADTTLPWWGFLIACLLSTVLLTFFAALTAMFGFSLLVQPFIQMIGAYLLPGKPLANMYFSTYGFNSLYQAKLMLKDLKLGQYTHLAPKCTFAMQLIGTSVGCLISYIMMEKITTEKRDVLMAIQGTNVWSGHMLQSTNTVAVAWGGLAKYLFSFGKRYQWVPIGFMIGCAAPLPFWLLDRYLFPKAGLGYYNFAIIAAALGGLAHGTHSAYLMHYALGFFCQFYLRRYRPNWFIKYNYILSAGMDGGSSLINFLLTFSVFGGAGKAVKFPSYWGNNHNSGNFDYCMRDPAMGKRHT